MVVEAQNTENRPDLRADHREDDGRHYDIDIQIDPNQIVFNDTAYFVNAFEEDGELSESFLDQYNTVLSSYEGDDFYSLNARVDIDLPENAELDHAYIHLHQDQLPNGHNLSSVYARFDDDEVSFEAEHFLSDDDNRYVPYFELSKNDQPIAVGSYMPDGLDVGLSLEDFNLNLAWGMGDLSSNWSAPRTMDEAPASDKISVDYFPRARVITPRLQEQGFDPAKAQETAEDTTRLIDAFSKAHTGRDELIDEIRQQQKEAKRAGIEEDIDIEGVRITEASPEGFKNFVEGVNTALSAGDILNEAGVLENNVLDMADEKIGGNTINLIDDQPYAMDMTAIGEHILGGELPLIDSYVIDFEKANFSTTVTVGFHVAAEVDYRIAELGEESGTAEYKLSYKVGGAQLESEDPLRVETELLPAFPFIIPDIVIANVSDALGDKVSIVNDQKEIEIPGFEAEGVVDFSEESDKERPSASQLESAATQLREVINTQLTQVSDTAGLHLSGAIKGDLEYGVVALGLMSVTHVVTAEQYAQIMENNPDLRGFQPAEVSGIVSGRLDVLNHKSFDSPIIANQVALSVSGQLHRNGIELLSPGLPEEIISPEAQAELLAESDQGNGEGFDWSNMVDEEKLDLDIAAARQGLITQNNPLCIEGATYASMAEGMAAASEVWQNSFMPIETYQAALLSLNNQRGNQVFFDSMSVEEVLEAYKIDADESFDVKNPSDVQKVMEMAMVEIHGSKDLGGRVNEETYAQAASVSTPDSVAEANLEQSVSTDSLAMK